jgi:hypothetical protein
MSLQDAQATINRLNNQISSLEKDVNFWKNQGDFWMGESSRWRDLASDFRKRLEVEQDFSKASTPKKLMMREGNVIFMNNIS